MLAAAETGMAELCSIEHPSTEYRKALPYPILTAIALAVLEPQGEFARLRIMERHMLAWVIKCISKDRPTDLTFVRRSTLAHHMECSLPTVTRLLARLEELGWIVRAQVKSRLKGFQVGGIALTEAAIRWLEFHIHSRPANGQARANSSQRRSCPIDACRYSIEEQSSQRQLACPSGPVDKSKTEKAVTTKGVNLPITLRWLVRHMSPFGVCKLMRLAREKQLRLEDVTNQCIEQIKGARNGYAYVRNLLGLDKDWKFLANAQHEKAVANEKAAEEKAALKRARAELSGQEFFDATKGLACRVEGQFVSWFRADESGRPVGDGVCTQPLDADFLGGVREGRLQRSTRAATESPVRHSRSESLPLQVMPHVEQGSAEVAATGKACQQTRERLRAVQAELRARLTANSAEASPPGSH